MPRNQGEIPRVVFLAGPNGSGKSTLTDTLRKREPTFLPQYFINPDDMEREEFGDLPPEERREAARQAGRERRQQYREEGADFALETIFSHPSNFSDIQSLRGDGYEIIILVVTTGDVQINVRRVEERKKAGGHGADATTVEQLYEKFHHLLPRIVEEADEARIYDTTHLENSDPILVFWKRQGRTRAIDIPDYLRDALLLPLRERAAEYKSLAERFPGLDRPDELRGHYEGTVKQVGHFWVLETPDGFTCHDSLLFPKQEVAQNTYCQIEYDATIADNRGWPRLTKN
jgi:predicted ABC-type ATPase